MLSTKTLSRRSVTTGFAAAVAAIPAAFALPAAIQNGQSTTDRLREFIRELYDERSRLTAGEWVHRKRAARVLQAIIGDEGEPWEPWEVETLAEMERTRQGPVWEARP